MLHQVPGSAGNLDALVFSPDGKLLAASKWDNKIQLIRVSTGALWRELPPQPEVTFALAFTPDGRTLISAGRDRIIRLWELDTASERRTLEGHTGAIYSLAISSDGRTLASASEDRTVLLHDLAARSRPLSLLEPERSWAALAAADAAKAEDAAALLMASPDAAVTFLAERLNPVRSVASEGLNRFIADLEHPRFVVRKEAERQLETLGLLAAPSLSQVLVGKPSLEMRRRVERLLALIEDERSAPEELRVIRAIEMLEHLATNEARQLLDRLASGARGARQTEAARAALTRLRR
jgi:WD domain, G-beta repeat